MPLKLQQDEPPQLNLTPMIDVLFLLIIFFMAASTFGELERDIKLRVPEVGQAGDALPPVKPIAINVFADGHYEINGQRLALDELQTWLSENGGQKGDSSVVIRGDAECAFQHVASALGACKAANISELGITVTIGSAGPSAQRR